jgi:hypothetical protein
VRLELLTPPALVGVREPGGQVLLALLIARRGDRRYVQISRGRGCNSLVWVEVDAVLPAEEAAAAPAAVPAPGAPTRGLPRALR